MNTRYALHATFGKPIIELSAICQSYFGINLRTAYLKANAQSLPIPAFRMDNSQRSPFFVNVDDLADYIDRRMAEAKAEFDSVH
ncbi:pyocin activator PrtN family protein [Ferrimonas senticii]|uniref:pyocin activator PrtN family protein n=1 Tax=Ferrimonas senticii TaxID=394566 RepID=UPI0004012E90|nr:pyocin activator PrtN family protein [Ferrimonas senticii]